MKKGVIKPIKKQKNYLTSQKTRILGHVLFDGSLYKDKSYHYATTYVNSSLNLVEQFMQDMKELYGVDPSSFEECEGVNVKYYRVKYLSKNIYNDLKQYNPSYSTSNKEIMVPKENLIVHKILK